MTDFNLPNPLGSTPPLDGMQKVNIGGTLSSPTLASQAVLPPTRGTPVAAPELQKNIDAQSSSSSTAVLAQTAQNLTATNKVIAEQKQVWVSLGTLSDSLSLAAADPRISCLSKGAMHVLAAITAFIGGVFSALRKLVADEETAQKETAPQPPKEVAPRKGTTPERLSAEQEIPIQEADSQPQKEVAPRKEITPELLPVEQETPIQEADSQYQDKIIDHANTLLDRFKNDDSLTSDHFNNLEFLKEQLDINDQDAQAVSDLLNTKLGFPMDHILRTLTPNKQVDEQDLINDVGERYHPTTARIAIEDLVNVGLLERVGGNVRLARK